LPDDVTISRADLIAVSRLLWSIGAEATTSHQHRVDCFHWERSSTISADFRHTQRPESKGGYVGVRGETEIDERDKQGLHSRRRFWRAAWQKAETQGP
jgi:hypothetical protein